MYIRNSNYCGFITGDISGFSSGNQRYYDPRSIERTGPAAGPTYPRDCRLKTTAGYFGGRFPRTCAGFFGSGA